MLICALYIPFFTMDALAIYYQIKSLHHLWHTYVMSIYCTSRFGLLFFKFLMSLISINDISENEYVNHVILLSLDHNDYITCIKLLVKFTSFLLQH